MGNVIFLKVFLEEIQKKGSAVCFFSFTRGYCGEFDVVFLPFLRLGFFFIRKKKGIYSILGILRCCSWGLGHPAWSACLGRPRAGWAGVAARAAPQILGRGAGPATVATSPRRRRRAAGTGPGSVLLPRR